MDQAVGAVHFEIFHSDNTKYRQNWKGLRLNDDYHRLYFIAAGEAEVVYNGVRQKLLAGHTYLFPTTKRFDYMCPSQFHLLNVCFKMTLQNGLDALALQPFEVELPAMDMNATLAAMTKIDAVLTDPTFANQVLVRGHIMSLLAPHFRTSETENARKRRQDMRRLAPALRHITQHVRTGVKIADLPALTNMSRSYFAKKFQTTFEMTPQNYVRKQRIELVKRELRASRLPLSALAEDFGFSSASHMTREFKAHTGYTPKDFRALDRFFD